MRWTRTALAPLGTVVARLAPVHRTRLLILQARRDDQLGRRRSALRGFRRALAIAAAGGLCYDEARAAAELAVRSGPSPARDEYAGRAEALFRRMGTSWELDHMQRRLTSS